MIVYLASRRRVRRRGGGSGCGSARRVAAELDRAASLSGGGLGEDPVDGVGEVLSYDVLALQ